MRRGIAFGSGRHRRISRHHIMAHRHLGLFASRIVIPRAGEGVIHAERLRKRDDSHKHCGKAL